MFDDERVMGVNLRGKIMRDHLEFNSNGKPKNFRYENELYRNSFGGNMIIAFTFIFFSGVLLGLGFLLRNMKMIDWFLYIAGVVIGCVAVVFICKGICNLVFKRNPKAYIYMSMVTIPPTVIVAYACLSKL